MLSVGLFSSVTITDSCTIFVDFDLHAKEKDEREKDEQKKEIAALKAQTMDTQASLTEQVAALEAQHARDKADGDLKAHFQSHPLKPGILHIFLYVWTLPKSNVHFYFLSTHAPF